MRRVPLLILLASVAGACRSTELPGLGADRGFTFSVEGNEAFGDAVLERALAFELAEYARAEFSRALADDAAYQAQVYYRTRGFPFAEVEDEVEETDEGPHLVLRVIEGPRTVVKDDAIEVVGVTVFPREEVRALFEGPRSGSFGGGDLLFVADRVSTVSGKLRSAYVARGFLDAAVSPVQVRFSEDRTQANLTLNVTEGPRYVVGDVTLAHESPPTPDELEPLDWERLFATVRTDADGKPRAYQPRVPWELRGTLVEALKLRGHPDPEVEVTAELDPAEARADLTVLVVPGPVARVGAVAVEGNERTRQSFMRSRLALEPGDRWTVDAERASLRGLYETGLFRRVDVALEELPAPADDAEQVAVDEVERDLQVRVEELPPRELWVEPGYGSYELLRLRAGLRDRNLFGTGRQLSLEAAGAIKTFRARLGLTDPWLFRTDLIGDLSVDFEQRVNPSFTERNTGFGAFVTREWTDSHASTFGYQFRRSDLLEFDEITGEVEAALSDVDLSSLRLSHRFDTRVPIFVPQAGSYVEGSLEWGTKAIGSELDFLRTTLFASTYVRLRESTVLATALRGGVIRPLEADEPIPLQERFFNGGENAVRSFQEDELGPKDPSGDPVGGQTYKTWSLELRQRVGDTSFELAGFYDVGDVRSDSSDWASLDGLDSAFGLGLRYQLPVGPLRLDVAWNPDPDESEAEVVLHFALGIAF